MKLSDSFEIKGEVNLELTAVQLNINSSYNEELKKGCPTLYQYVCYVEKVKKRKCSNASTLTYYFEKIFVQYGKEILWITH